MKKNQVVRNLSLILVMLLCIAMISVTAIAEEDFVISEDVEEMVPEISFEIIGGDAEIIEDAKSIPSTENTRTVGDLLATGMDDFIRTTTIPLTLSSGNWSADFLASVTGNPGAIYEVVLVSPGGSTHTINIYSSGGAFTIITTMMYASAGTYNFRFTRCTGSAVTAYAVAEIRD